MKTSPLFVRTPFCQTANHWIWLKDILHTKGHSRKKNLLMVYLNASDAWSFFASLQHLWITWFMAKSIKPKQYTITLDLEGSTVAAMLSHIHLVTDCGETWTQWLMGVGTTFDQQEIEVSGHLLLNTTYYVKIFKIYLLPQSTFCSWKLVIMFFPAMHKFWDSRLFYVIRGQKVKNHWFCISFQLNVWWYPNLLSKITISYLKMWRSFGGH